MVYSAVGSTKQHGTLRWGALYTLIYNRRTSSPFIPRLRSFSRKSISNEREGNIVICPLADLCVLGFSKEVLKGKGRLVPIGRPGCDPVA